MAQTIRRPGGFWGKLPALSGSTWTMRQVLDAAPAQRRHEARVGERGLGRALEVLVD